MSDHEQLILISAIETIVIVIGIIVNYRKVGELIRHPDEWKAELRSQTAAARRSAGRQVETR